MENNKEKFEERIMSKIRSGKVRLRSKYIILAEKLGIESAFALSLILSILFINLFFFYLKATDNLEYLSFGSEGIYAFLESFPYALVTALIIFVFIAGHILAKADISYMKPFNYFALSFVAFVFISGAILAYTDVPEKLEAQAFGNEPAGAIWSPFLKKGVELRSTGIAGEISKIDGNYLILMTPNGEQGVSLENLDPGFARSLEASSFIIAVGERRNGVFVVKKMRIVKEEHRMPMIKRRIRIQYNGNINGLFFFPESHLPGVAIRVWM